MIAFKVDDIIKNALAEDMNYGDITSDALLTDRHTGTAELISKADGVIAGIDIFERVFQMIDTKVMIQTNVQNGEHVVSGQLLAVLSGPSKSILMGERTALNILQRMSGIATMTASFKEAVADIPVRIADTRKTAPGLRVLDKLAVKYGGGHNHRFNLSDVVMIKDNHIKAVGGISEAVKRARARIPHTTKIEVEVESICELREAIEAGAEVVMLDNMSLEMMKEAVEIGKGKVVLEASGNVSICTLREVAETGVDVISVGALTHSVKALDVSLRFL